MINQQIIDINNTSNGVTFSNFSPFTMVLSTSGYTSLNKIWKIAYDFGNGDTQTVELKPTTETSTNLPIPSEPGDPRNSTVKSYYFFDDNSYKTYNLTIKFYTIGAETPETLNFSLYLRVPTIAEVLGLSTDIKVVGSRMFGLDNQLLYFLESQNPNYLLPVLMKF